MAVATDNWSETLTQGYLALRSGMSAEAASVFANVALKAPPDIARVARLEIRARFLDKVIMSQSGDNALVFDSFLDTCFPGVSSSQKELLRQASKAVLSDLEQEGRVLVLGPLFMTRYAFQQKKLRLIGMLSQHERGVLEWGKALDFIVGNGKGTLVGRQEWRKVSRLLREGGTLLCNSSRVQSQSAQKPLDLLHEWMSLTLRPIKMNSALNQAIGHKGTLDEHLFEAARQDPRFRAVGDYLWLELFASDLEARWAKALDSVRTAVDARRWSISNLSNAQDLRNSSPPKDFCKLLQSKLGQMAEDKGFERVGDGLWAKPDVFMAQALQHFRRLKKLEITLSEMREGLGLRDSRLSGGTLWSLTLLLGQAGFVRQGRRFFHAPRVADAVRSLIESGAPEPLLWADVQSHLKHQHKLEITKDELRRVLERDVSLVSTAEGLLLRERKASPDQVRQSLSAALGDRGYASDQAICSQVREDWGLVATPSQVSDILSGDLLYTRIHGGWALAPEFDWIAETRSHLTRSDEDSWGRGFLGWLSAEDEAGLTTSVEREKGSFTARSATFFVTGADILNSRLQIYSDVSALFPAGRFVAVFRGAGGIEATVRGDGNSCMIQFPLGFLRSGGLTHGDEVRITSSGGWPPRYELQPTGNFDARMRSIGESLETDIVRTLAHTHTLEESLEAALRLASCPVSVCEIADMLALCSIRPGYRTLVSEMRKYSYFKRQPGGRYTLDSAKRRQYLLRISDLEEQIRKMKDEVRQAETMVLAFRGENAKLKSENRELKQRLSNLEVERLRSSEAMQTAKNAIERLNSQLRNATTQQADLQKRLEAAESMVGDLVEQNKRLLIEISKTPWIKIARFFRRLFGQTTRDTGFPA